MEEIKIATQLESVLSFTAERSTISAVCDFYEDNLNQWYSTGAKSPPGDDFMRYGDDFVIYHIWGAISAD